MSRNMAPSAFGLPEPVVEPAIASRFDLGALMGTAALRSDLMSRWAAGAAVGMPALVTLSEPSGGFVALFDLLPVVAADPASFHLLAPGWPWREALEGSLRPRSAGRLDPFEGARAEAAGEHFGKALEFWVARLCPDWMGARASAALLPPRSNESWREGPRVLEFSLRAESPEPWPGALPEELQELRSELSALRGRRVEQARGLLSSLGPVAAWRPLPAEGDEYPQEPARELWGAFVAARQRLLLGAACEPAAPGPRAPRI